MHSLNPTNCANPPPFPSITTIGDAALPESQDNRQLTPFPALRRQDPRQSNLRRARRAPRPQRGVRSGDLLRASDGVGGRRRQAVAGPRDSAGDPGAAVHGVPRPRPRGAHAARRAAHLPPVRGHPELRVRVQGDSEREVWRWYHECYLLQHQRREGGGCGWRSVGCYYLEGEVVSACLRVMWCGAADEL